ncbi:hypothetical protein BX600DRAFT_439118 [Xylariales sp. PMI_506]|nr:hypothetical protein BX600DRAFT_439118 [Xylariales sp. PMI_506]
MLVRFGLPTGILRIVTFLGLFVLAAWFIDTVTNTRQHLARLQTVLVSDDPNAYRTSKAAFLQTASSKGIYPEPYDGASIQKLCSSTEWRPGYFISCDESIVGGIGNVKVGIVGCVRFAIAAGASLIVPTIHQRTAFGKMGESFDWNNGVGLDYLIDYEHFKTTLRADCPQLNLVEQSSNDEVKSGVAFPTAEQKYKLNPKSLGATQWGNVLLKPLRWKDVFDGWVKKNILDKTHIVPSNTTPIRVDLLDTAFAWPSSADGQEFARNFGRIVRFPPAIRALSGRALYTLYKRLGIEDSPAAISQGAFLGAHLRTEGDAQVEGWQSYEKQRAQIRETLERQGLHVLYVASGNQTQVELLQAYLADLRIPVVVDADTGATREASVRVYQKWDLFDEDNDPETGRLVGQLSWDQLALVDMDIMFRASQFIGLSESSFSWTIALQRHAWSEENPYDYTEHPITFQDDLSALYGNPGAMQLVPATVWL